MEIVFIILIIAYLAVFIQVFVFVFGYSYELVRRAVIYRNICKKNKKQL